MINPTFTSNEKLIEELTSKGVVVPEWTSRAELISLYNDNIGASENTDPDPASTLENDDDIFDGPAQAPEVKIFSDTELPKDEEMQLVPKAVLSDILSQLNELRNKDGAVDLSQASKRKRIVRVSIYTDVDAKEYLVTGLRERASRDGSKRQTWERGRDEITEKIITWCDPVLVDLDTGVQQDSKEIRYSEFMEVCTTIPLEVQKDLQENIDMTPKASENEVVEQVTYEEKDWFYKRQPSGLMVKVKVWGVKRTFVVEYEGRTYHIDESVINLK